VTGLLFYQYAHVFFLIEVGGNRENEVNRTKLNVNSIVRLGDAALRYHDKVVSCDMIYVDRVP
jgi:hypothetical protein